MKTSLRLLLVAVFAVLFVGTASAHYNPQLGRWLSRDPMGEAGGFNLYAYCGNDPVNRHDPLGLQGWQDPRGLPGCPPGLRLILDEQDRERARSLANDIKAVGLWMDEHPRAMGVPKIVGGLLGMAGSGFLETGTGGLASPIALPAFAGSAGLWGLGLRQVITGDRVTLAGQLEKLGVDPADASGLELSLDVAMVAAPASFVSKPLNGRVSTEEAIIYYGFLKKPNLSQQLPHAEFGHFGFSFDGGKTIFGFGPAIDGVKLEAVVARLRAGEKFAGSLSNHTEIFLEAQRLGIEVRSLSLQIDATIHRSASLLARSQSDAGALLEYYALPRRFSPIPPGAFNLLTGAQID
jgi:hypothetical protein